MVGRLVFILLLLASTVEAKNLYVNNSGSPACDDATTYANNDASNPWCGLIRASRGNTDGNRNTAGVSGQAAQAGDVVLVTAGTYTYTGAYYDGDSWLSVLYNPVNSGTSEAWIEFRTVGTVYLAQSSTVSGQPGNSHSATIGSTLTGGQYIKWDGFTLDENYSPWRNGMVIANNDNITLTNLRVTCRGEMSAGANHDGIQLHYGVVSGAPQSCDGTVNNVTVSNSIVTGCKEVSGHNASGIKLYCIGDNVTVNNNELYGNDVGIYNKTQNGPETNVRIFKNYIHDNEIDGIRIHSPTNWDIYQNVIINSSTGFVMMNTEYYTDYPTTLQPHDIRFVNNTLYGNTESNISIQGWCAAQYDNVVQNNLLSGSPRESINSEGADCQTQAYIGTDDIAFDYNYHTWSTHFYANDGGGSVISYATWTATWGQDVNSVQNGDPIFVNAAGGDFRLCTATGVPDAGCSGASPAINAGIDILDLDGDSSTVDAITIGAYITGNEVIGIDAGEEEPPAAPTRTISAPSNLRWLFMGIGSRTIQLLQ